MAAVPIHVVRLGLKPVSEAGVVLDKESVSINAMLTATSEIRVIANSAVPNSLGFPTVEAFLALEAAQGYSLRHIDQTMIVLYGS